MPRRGQKGLEAFIKECLEADNGRAAKALVESAVRVAITDGMQLLLDEGGNLVLDEDGNRQLVFNKNAWHPDSQQARRDLLDRYYGKPATKVEVSHKKPQSFLLDPDMVALHGARFIEIEDVAEDGTAILRQVVAAPEEGETVDDVLAELNGNGQAGGDD